MPVPYALPEQLRSFRTGGCAEHLGRRHRSTHAHAKCKHPGYAEQAGQTSSRNCGLSTPRSTDGVASIRLDPQNQVVNLLLSSSFIALRDGDDIRTWCEIDRRTQGRDRPRLVEAHVSADES